MRGKLKLAEPRIEQLEAGNGASFVHYKRSRSIFSLPCRPQARAISPGLIRGMESLNN